MLPASLRAVRRERPLRRIRSGRVVGAALAGILAVGLAACAPDPATESYLNGENKGYVSVDLTITEFPVEERGEAVDFGGVTEHGEQFSSDDTRGGVTVVNFWYAACGPCRVEAKDLEAVWQEYEGQDVAFIGVNIYDQAGTAKAFAEQYGVTYPSLIDVNTGEAKLAFARVAPTLAPPTTLVLDAEGRVAARILGQLESPSVLSTIVGDVLAETA